MKNKVLYTLLIILVQSLHTTALNAQHSTPTEQINPYRIVERCTLHGISLLNNLDTYLSGYNYTGAGYYFNHENLRNAHTGNYNWKYLTTFSATLGYTKQQSNSQFTLLASRYWSGYHPFRVSNRLQLWTGAQIQLAGGALYVPANGNNMVSVKMRTALAATGIAIYRLPVRQHTIDLRYRIDIPLAGIMFSPEFGQSYYEIFGLGNTHGVIKFAHPLNSPSWQHTLSADIPIGNNTLRIAYTANLYQSKVNSLRTHIYNHSFAIGFAKTIYKIKRKDSMKAYSPLL